MKTTDKEAQANEYRDALRDLVPGCPKIPKAELEDKKLWLHFYKGEGTKEVKQALNDALRFANWGLELGYRTYTDEDQRESTKPAIEFLEEAPKRITRPLSLIDGTSYAATWLWAKVTVSETQDKKGNIVKHDPPLITEERRLVLVRNDGALFCQKPYQGHETFKDIGLDVHLSDIPQDSKLWSAKGVKAYLGGYRPDLDQVFERVVDVVDRFIDFDRSLADQRTMAEMSACYALSTWFLPSFNIVGYLWLNGDKGVGKTKYIHTICEMSYLGLVILSGGSYASLRDLADYGATLGFDDAEDLMDPKKGDPDKKALLLAGNRRGSSTVTVKEPTASKTWTTRHINAFCPRLFSAIKLPDHVLGSRSIVIPLVRSADRQKANNTPAEPADWPHDRQALVDDLWALALTHLPEMPDLVKKVNEKTGLLGRALEPWRGILSVALWLDENGIEGIYQRMEDLAMSYQKEKPTLELADLTVLVVKALASLHTNHTIHTNHTNREIPRFLELTTVGIRDKAKEIAEDEELWFAKEGYLTSDKIGRVMGKLRLEKIDRVPGTTKRGWRITLTELERITSTYAIPLEISVKSVNSVTSVKKRKVNLTDLAMGDDHIQDNEVIVNGERIPF